MIVWQGKDHPVPEPIVWTKRGLLVMAIVRWVTATILAVVLAAAMTVQFAH